MYVDDDSLAVKALINVCVLMYVDDDSLAVKDTAVDNRSKVMVWDGHKIDNQLLLTGRDCEPVLITITFGNPSNFSWGFSKAMTVGEFRLLVSAQIGIVQDNMVLTRVIDKGNTHTTLHTLLRCNTKMSMF